VARITKMQQRRGLRRDLPVPLAPGEFGLATDSRELFIGNDLSDSLSGIQNKTVQVGSFATGFNFTNSHLQNNLSEFIVKRDVLTGLTGTGGFDILSLHSGLSPSAAHASGVKLEGGINDQTLTVHKYSPVTASHSKLTPGDPDGTPVTINDYKLSGGVGSLQIEFTKALVATDVVYVVHLTKRDLEIYLVSAFNASYDDPAGLGNTLTDAHHIIDISQLYFDQSTGEGFIGFNDAQIPKADLSTNVPTPGAPTGPSNKSIKEWFDEWIVASNNKLNGAISSLGNAYWGNGDGTTVNISNEGGYGVTLFGADAETTVPTYTMDETFAFPGRSHVGAVNLSNFLNYTWLAEGSDPTRQLTHLRSNIRVVTDENVGDVFANLIVTNPLTRTVSDTTAPGSSSTNPVNGTQVYRPLGSVYTTTNALVGVMKYNLTTMTNLEVDYTVTFTDNATYHVVRNGRFSASFPLLADGSNIYGHATVLDQWNEVDIMSASGAVSAFGATQIFEVAVVVAKRVTTSGDPVIEREYDNAVNNVGTSVADYLAKYGEAHTSAVLIDNDSTSPTYGNYFGFLLYQNERGVDGTIEFIQRRF
jgi:hypothetical protein